MGEEPVLEDPEHDVCRYCGVPVSYGAPTVCGDPSCEAKELLYV